MKLTVLLTAMSFFAVTASAQNMTQHLPVTDAEKIADALRAGQRDYLGLAGPKGRRIPGSP